MPRTKRSKIVSLTKTLKKGKELKQDLIENVRILIYLFTFEFFYGKNKVMQIAFGKNEASEPDTNLHLLSEQLVGGLGVLFTNDSPETISSFAKSFVVYDYPGKGWIADRTITLSKGELVKGSDFYNRYIDPSRNTDADAVIVDQENSSSILDTFQASMEPYLRKLGLPVSLVNGHIILISDYTLCKAGSPIDVNTRHLLKLFDAKLAPFKINLVCSC
ncbi:hypothetical protein BB560_006968 [Smittium megazygosporum]|uniref:Large ribosomal subunit protein uL10-like insertion domain-containing protein n=1 Tax=Smittium megazygosporum TaxID=133381 RepID=A0A2T9XZW7_9FUNG|nr:hypothetical protein BB560_006968 [Smittium megazygosporum]